MSDKIEQLLKSLENACNSLEKDDELDAKIKAKMKAEMDKRGFGEADATRHVIDRDRGEKQVAAPKPPKQLMQSEGEYYRANSAQWKTPERQADDAPLKKGAEVVAKALTTGEVPPFEGIRIQLQPTDEQLFGHLVTPPELAKAREEEWKTRGLNIQQKLAAPIDHLNQSKVIEKEWKSGTSFNSLLTEEERKKRGRVVE